MRMTMHLSVGDSMSIRLSGKIRKGFEPDGCHSLN
jgi:hypothetical protein